MTLKLGICPGHNGKFVLLQNKNIVYQKNIPYLREERIIKYGEFADIFKEIRAKAQELNDKIKVYILSNYTIRETEFKSQDRLICQGVIQGLLIADSIKFINYKYNNINRVLSKPYAFHNRNRELYLIMQYGANFIDTDKDDKEKNVLSNILIMLNEND